MKTIKTRSTRLSLLGTPHFNQRPRSQRLGLNLSNKKMVKPLKDVAKIACGVWALSVASSVLKNK